MIKKLILNKSLLIKIILSLTIVFYILFLYIDANTQSLGNISSIYLKYAIIVLSFIITLLIGNHGYNKFDRCFLQCAKLFTLIADYYLLIHDNFAIGIFFFCLVQLTYIIRHSLMEHKQYKNVIFLALVLVNSMIISFKINYTEKKLIILALVYAALLLTSVYSAVGTLTRGKYTKDGAMLIIIGMVLFFLCDLSVGAYNIIGKTSLKAFIPANIEFLIGYLIWVFYAPSQVLLALSGFKSIRDVS
jgi:FtsH-binding integral membrane protein